nr:unnamed protein product [Callosobruchus chinensis]
MEIFPTRDQKHVVVVVRSAFGTKSFLLLYALDCTSDKMVKLHEEPVAVKELDMDQKPVEVKPLPNVEKFDVKSESLTAAEGDEHEEDDLFGMNVDTSAPVAHQLDSLDPRLVKCFYVEPDVIQLEDLKKLRQLCEFEPLKTG